MSIPIPIFSPIIMIVDAHLDLAFNALDIDRNLLLNLADLREYEKNKERPYGIATATFPEMRKGGVGLIFGTIFQERWSKKGTLAQKIVYRTADEAYANGIKQLDYYRRLADENQSIRMVGDLKNLEEVVDGQDGERPLLGIVPLMEGADAVRDPAELEEWWERGLRIIGPAWDDTKYAAGAWRNASHGFTKDGFYLMEVMADLGFVMDLTHLHEKATFEALERYEGGIVATHANCRAIASHVGMRNLSDKQIRLLGERGGVIGVVLYNIFLKQGHSKAERRDLVTLDHVVAHIDHICQLLGTAAQVGIGSDFDGGFGWANIPAEMNSIADLGMIGTKLKERGYGEEDIANILGDNWVNFLRRTFSSS